MRIVTVIYIHYCDILQEFMKAFRFSNIFFFNKILISFFFALSLSLKNIQIEFVFKK